MTKQTGEKSHVLLAPSDELRYREVVDFEAQPGAGARVLVADWDDPVPSSGGQHRRVFPDAVGVVAEGLMER